jgi:hypothetical protein
MAGKITSVDGEVKIVAENGEVRSARVGDEVKNGDSVVTGRNSTAEISHRDGTVTRLNPERQHNTIYDEQGNHRGNSRPQTAPITG